MGNREVTGRLVFAEQVEGVPKPLHNMRVELWDRDLMTNLAVTCGFTDMDGTFTLTYDPDDVGPTWFQKPSLVLRVMDRDYHYTDDDQPAGQWELIAAFERSSSLGTRSISKHTQSATGNTRTPTRRGQLPSRPGSQ